MIKRKELFKRVTGLFMLLIVNFLLLAQDGNIRGTPSIAYWKQGNSDAMVIVLHGGPGAAHDYLIPEWNALNLSATVIYYDQRGTGKSERAECYSWKEHVGDLKRLINQLSNGKKVILAGSSWGSALALLYSYSFPEDVKGIILSGTYNWLGKGEPEKDCLDYLPPQLGFLRDTGSFHPMTMQDPASPASVKTKIIEVHHRSNSMLNASMRNAPPIDALSNIKQPVLIFKGGGICTDIRPKEGAAIYGAVLPAAVIVTIGDACHDPWITHPEAFFSRCIKFIDLLK